jgi:hydrogenase maturation protease
MSSNNHENILIVGIGNIIMMDEGIGIYAIRELEKLNLPLNVTIFDAGTDVFKIMSCENDFDTVIIIDAVQKKDVPGTIHRMELDEIETEPTQNNLHQISFVEALRLMKLSISNIRTAKVILYGIEPEIISFGVGLSPQVQRSMNLLIDIILNEIENARSVISEEHTRNS